MSDNWPRFSGLLSGAEQHEFIPFVHRLIGSVFATIRPYFLQPLAVESKTDRSPVTQADRQTELALRRLIDERYPHHALRGEEYGQRTGGPYRWVLDCQCVRQQSWLQLRCEPFTSEISVRAPDQLGG